MVSPALHPDAGPLRAGPALAVQRLAHSSSVVALLTTCVGLLLAIAGAICASVALFQTWRQHERRPLFPMLAAALRRARTAARHLTRWRKPRNQTIQASAVLSASSVMQAHLTVQGPAIPEDAPVDEAVRLLVRRVERIDENAREDRQQHKTSVKELRTELASAAAALRETDDDLRALTKNVAVSTVKLQLWGLILVGTGTVLMMIPTIIAMIVDLS